MKMEINRLTQDELTYEMDIRGVRHGSVEEMRKNLRAALNSEKLGQSIILKNYPFDFKTDRECITKKLSEISELLKRYQSDKKDLELKKLYTKISWLLKRVERSQPSGDEEVQEKINFRNELVLTLGNLHENVETTDSEVESSGNENISTITKSCNNDISIYKWNLKFSGGPDQSLNSFLDRVLELSEARGVTRGQLFKAALDLFEGRALIWCRANKNNVNSWAELVSKLRKEFLLPDCDDRLTDEIKRRTQGKDESIGSYVAVMINMFSRLTIPISESEQLRILKRNISPFYQTQIGLSDVKTMQELVDLGKKLESIRASVESYIPPPTRRTTYGSSRTRPCLCERPSVISRDGECSI